MLNRMANFFVRIFERWMPDPFLFCVLLTALTFALAWALTPAAPGELVTQWYDGLWSILPFAMQMILILLTGFVLASSGPVRRGLAWLASQPKSQGSAVVLLTVASALAALLHWGFALVASAMLARELARRVPGCDFGFLVAAAYSGFVIWGSGLSSSIALVSATAGSRMNFIAIYTELDAVPLSQTLLLPMNLALVAGTLILLPVMFRLMMPKGDQIRVAGPQMLAEDADETNVETDDETNEAQTPPTPAQRLERSWMVLYLLVALGGFYLVRHFWTNGFALNLNVVILLFFVLGMALHGRASSYLKAFNQAGKLAGPLALQYPLYGGIMGLMVGSGLAAQISKFFVATSTQATFPFLTFVGAAIVNFFVPSGGGQWAVQGPVMIPAAVELGVSPAVTAMAVAFGDQLTNMLQPFWALPILAIAGLNIRHIMGYCVMTFLLVTALSTLVLFLLA